MLLDLWPLLVEEPAEEPPVLPAVGGYYTHPRILSSRPRPVAQQRLGRSRGVTAITGRAQGSGGRLGSTTGDTTSTGSAIGVKQAFGATRGTSPTVATARGVKVETAVDDEEFLILALL